MWVLIVLIITIGAVCFFAMISKAGKRAHLTAKETLELRFAKGQISEADFLRSMAVLEHDKLLELED
jgi:uncharacterized membrane protein